MHGTIHRRFTRALLVALPIGLLAGCGTSGRAPNLVVIVIDTLRADRLGPWGSTRGLSPFLDSVAARGVVFRRAYAQSSWTDPSVASLVTSRYQSQHGFIGFGSVLADHELTLAEVLKERGYGTAGFSANGLLSRKAGFAQGYETYEAHWLRRLQGPDGKVRWQNETAERINRETLAWIDARAGSGARGPAFLYLQYVEPHTPYDPPPELLDRVLAGRPRPDLAKVQQTYFRGVVEPLSADELRAVEDCYDATVMDVDARIRELFDGLAARGFLDHAVVVITSDHGEEFKDHGFMGHGGTLYEELIHVPLIVLPSAPEHAEVDDIVSLVDVAPTLLAVAGIPVPASFEGRSLAAHVVRPSGLAALWRRPAPPAPTDAYSELLTPETLVEKRLLFHERAIVSGRRKLITGLHGERELYDLAADPRER
ncbi:MAG TPA: sulfatase, partial [Candidatus Binatia bacterium]|nr:sulfatase [Candidatus Binatia bacterium]